MINILYYPICFSLVALVITVAAIYMFLPLISHQLSMLSSNPLTDVKHRQQSGEKSQDTKDSAEHIFDEVAQIEDEIKRRKALEEAGEIKKIRMSDIVEKREGIKKAAVTAGRETMLSVNEHRNSEVCRAEESAVAQKPPTTTVRVSDIIDKREAARKATLKAGREPMLSASEADKKSTMSFAQVMELQERKRNRLLGGSSSSSSGAERDYESATAGGAALVSPPGRHRGAARVQDEVVGYHVATEAAEVLANAHMGVGAGAGSTGVSAVRAQELARERALVAEQDAAYNESLLLDQNDNDNDNQQGGGTLSMAAPEEVDVTGGEAEEEDTLLLEEPDSSEPSAVTIQFQIKLTKRKQLTNQLAASDFKDTVKRSRRFLRTSPLSSVVRYMRATCRELGVSKSFEIIVPYPKKVLFSTNSALNVTHRDLDRQNQTLAELELEGKCVLYVHPVELAL